MRKNQYGIVYFIATIILFKRVYHSSDCNMVYKIIKIQILKHQAVLTGVYKKNGRAVVHKHRLILVKRTLLKVIPYLKRFNNHKRCENLA